MKCCATTRPPARSSDVFVTAGSGGIDGPHGLTFGPDANGDGVPELYVTGSDSFNVVRYDGATGQPLGTYITTGSGGLSWPGGIDVRPERDLPVRGEHRHRTRS